VLAAYNAGVAAGNTTALSNLLFGRTGAISFNTATKTPNFRFPFRQTFNFNKVLPNAGVTYRINDDQQVYATYAKGFSAPKTDDLYSSATAVVQPESSDSYAAGWRYQSAKFTTSLSAWDVAYHNRIVQSFDPADPTLSIDRNIGEVQIYGLDLEGGARLFDHLSLYGSAEFLKSDVKSNEIVAAVGGVAFALPTKGKELVLSPDTVLNARAQYDFGWIDAGLQVKYSSKRFIDDTNTASLPDYTTLNFDARMPLTWWGLQNTYLQFNIYNLTNTRYPTRVNSISNANNVQVGTTNIFGKSYFYTYDAPRAVTLTLHAQF
jgi:iron complex outermembrane receptor protein